MPRINVRGLLSLAIFLLLACSASAATIKLSQVGSAQRDGRFLIDASYQITLDDVHENALQSGVPLTFSINFVLNQPRWYWAMRRVGDWFEPTAHLEKRLSYHVLTNTYRVGVGSLYQSYDRLSDALAAVGVIRDWQVFERGFLTRKLDTRIGGDIVMKLDLGRLPKPMQVSLSDDPQWKLESDRFHLEFADNR
ncbi:DUF4390 domain-containing protein [Burkholderiaceae bacterium DAT-1]|nr:DUF4390 domain-containing protein [Burkholderiaceae bacterium DAT-1]